MDNSDLLMQPPQGMFLSHRILRRLHSVHVSLARWPRVARVSSGLSSMARIRSSPIAVVRRIKGGCGNAIFAMGIRGRDGPLISAASAKFGLHARPPKRYQGLAPTASACPAADLGRCPQAMIGSPERRENFHNSTQTRPEANSTP